MGKAGNDGSATYVQSLAWGGVGGTRASS